MTDGQAEKGKSKFINEKRMLLYNYESAFIEFNNSTMIIIIVIKTSIHCSKNVRY